MHQIFIDAKRPNVAQLLLLLFRIVFVTIPATTTPSSSSGRTKIQKLKPKVCERKSRISHFYGIILDGVTVEFTHEESALNYITKGTFSEVDHNAQVHAIFIMDFAPKGRRRRRTHCIRIINCFYTIAFVLLSSLCESTGGNDQAEDFQKNSKLIVVSFSYILNCMYSWTVYPHPHHPINSARNIEMNYYDVCV